MFIRRKIKTLKGQSYEQRRLLKSVRTAAGPRQEVVLNLGALELPKDQWKALANATEENIALIKKEEMHYVAISRKQSYDPCLWDQREEKTVLLKDGKTELSLKKRLSSAQGGVVPKT